MACWLDQFLAQPSSRWFLRIDEQFLTDGFNSFGLKPKIPHFSLAYALICSRAPHAARASERVSFETIEAQAFVVYARLHARFLATERGIALMEAKYASFPLCPRVFCKDVRCLPHGVSHAFGEEPVALLCPGCGDLYKVAAPELAKVDGAFFGPNWAHLFVKRHPEIVPRAPSRVYVPKIFGFRIDHPNAPSLKRESSSDG
jgi:casein kinase II subunit beta